MRIINPLPNLLLHLRQLRPRTLHPRLSSLHKARLLVLEDIIRAAAAGSAGVEREALALALGLRGVGVGGVVGGCGGVWDGGLVGVGVCEAG